jgi:hypothetical protein
MEETRERTIEEIMNEMRGYEKDMNKSTEIKPIKERFGAFISEAERLISTRPTSAKVCTYYAGINYRTQVLEGTASPEDLQRLNELEEKLNFPLTE